jgi:SIR2-like domain
MSIPRIIASDSDVRAFVRSICNDLEHLGYWIIPFTGAGFSVPSGVPAAPQLRRYQSYSLLKALGIDPLQEPPEKNGPWILNPPHNLRASRWPEMAVEMLDRECVRTTADLERLLHAAMSTAEEKGELFGSGTVRIPAKTIRMGYGSLADWRAALDFLSRLTIQSGGGSDQTPEVVAGIPEPSVKDAFFREIVQFKQPSLGHRMLPALCPVLRSHVLLSTNFDDLLEEAFHAVNHPLAVFSVPENAALPGSQLVLAQRSVLKLHGSSHGLWVDDAIDRVPEEADRNNFLGYLAGRPLPQVASALREPVGLLLAGVSGNDQRTVSLLRSAMQTFSQLHVYWLCYSDWDEKLVRKMFFGKLRPRGDTAIERDGETPNECWVWPLRHSDQGLFLLQLYQASAGSVPTAGIIFPALWELPAPVQIPLPGGVAHTQFDRYVNIIRKLINTELSKLKGAKPIHVFPTTSRVRGVVPVCAELFFAESISFGTEGGRHAPVRRIWIDLEGIVEPVGFFLRLALLLAKGHGDADPICVLDLRGFYSSGPSFEAFRETLLYHLREAYARSGEKLVVFANGYDGAGTCPLFVPSDSTKRKLWRDEIGVGNFISLIETINDDSRCGIQFILTTRANPKSELYFSTVAATDDEVRERILRMERQAVQSLSRVWEKRNPENWSAEAIPEDCSDYSRVEAAQIALHFASGTLELPNSQETGEQRRLRPHFLYLLTIFRVTRYPASLLRILYVFARETHTAGSMEERRPRLSAFQHVIDDWLHSLHECRTIFFKVGGFVWMSHILKTVLARAIILNGQVSRDQGLFLESLVARWYGRLLLGCANPLAATQSIEHGLQALRRWHAWPKRVGGRDPVTNDELARLQLTVEHAQLIFEVAKGLWRNRLSDQFASRALLGLQTAVKKTIRTFKNRLRRNLLPEAPAIQLVASLERLRDAIHRFRSSLSLLEGEFADVLKLTDEIAARFPEPVLSKPETHNPNWTGERAWCSALLEKATALGCLRRYAAANRLFAKLWERRYASEPSLVTSAAVAARHWLFGTESAAPRADWERRMICRLARARLYLALHESQAIYCHLSASDRHGEAIKQRRTHLESQGEWFAEFALEVLRSIHTDGARDRDCFVYEENVRVRAHSALCHAILDFCDEKAPALSRRKFAESLLTDAESYIDEFPLKDRGIYGVILDLRRAELELLRVNEPSGTDSTGGAWFRAFRRALKKVNAFGSDPLINLTAPPSESLRPPLARIYDAFRYLERAEIGLREHPKNRWWWWIFCVLKMKATEYVQVIRLAFALNEPKDAHRTNEHSRVIPNEAIAFFARELPAVVRNSGLNDCFQLARLVDSYGRTIVASHLRRMATASVRLIEPLEQRKKTFDDLLDRLESSNRSAPLAEIDSHVIGYSKSVAESAVNLSARIQTWLTNTVASRR